MSESGLLDDLMPDESWMIPVWLGCLNFAIKNPEMVAAFRAETGHKWEPGRTPIDRMIDEATGADAAFIRAFAEWHNENIWGTGDEDEETS